MRHTPIPGTRILLTRPDEQSARWAEELKLLGAEPVILPLIGFQSSEPARPERPLAAYDWIVFTSVNGVRFFFEALEQLCIDASAISKIKIAAIGSRTAGELVNAGLQVDFIPRGHTAETLAKEIPDIEQRRILLPATDIAREATVALLRQRGALPEEWVVYRTVKLAENGRRLPGIIAKGLDILTFASPSAVECFAAYTGIKELKIPAVCIGPSTAAAAFEKGFKQVIMSKEHTAEGLTKAITDYIKNEKQTPQA